MKIYTDTQLTAPIPTHYLVVGINMYTVYVAYKYIIQLNAGIKQ